MARVVNCPKCNEQGSLQPKKTAHGTYWRIAHYIGLNGETRKIKWCYIGKELPESITSQLITQKERLQNKPKLGTFNQEGLNQPLLPVSLADTRRQCRLIRIC